MKLLVCGGRHFSDHKVFDKAMKDLPFIPTMIIEGGALGADSLARHWAIKNGIHCATVRALWLKYSKRAGPIRNEAMLLLKPDHCLAMPGGTGTHDMVSRCEIVGIPVTKVNELKPVSKWAQ